MVGVSRLRHLADRAYHHLKTTLHLSSVEAPSPDTSEATWPNPSESIGKRIDNIPVKPGYICWEAKGEARKLWMTLGPEIAGYISHYDACENLQLAGDLMVEIYMVGRTKETAVPRVFFQSNDALSQSRARDVLGNSRILDSHPGIGLWIMPANTRRFATEDIEVTPPIQQYQGPRQLVHSKSPIPLIGQQLFVPTQVESHLRPITGGPFLYIGGKVLQLTAGHPFRETNNSDLQSPSGNINANITGVVGHATPPDTNAKEPDVSCSSHSHPRGSWSRTRGPGAKSDFTQPSLAPVGQLFDLPELSGLDYALIEYHSQHHTQNRIPFWKDTFQTWLYITGEKEIGHEDISVATVTSSKGFLPGRLCATPSFLRSAGTPHFQTVYPVTLKAPLAQGDCGSPIVDRLHGHFYGHVVAGVPGTGRAYIIPATEVIRSIEERQGQRVSFSSLRGSVGESMKSEKGGAVVKKRKPPRYNDDGPIQQVDFGSKAYFEQLRSDHRVHTKPALHSKPALASSSAATVPANALLSLASRPLPLSTPPVASSLDRTRGTSGDHTGIHERLRRTTTTTCLPQLTGTAKIQGRASDATCCVSAFQVGFSRLPGEIKGQIAGYLDIPDILNLRLVSRSWNNFVTSEEAEIAISYLRQPHLPTLAVELFPPAEESPASLRHVAGLRHRYHVASQLSALMTDWITRVHFLRRSPSQRAEFRRYETLIRRRLVPPLLVIHRYFEKYRELLLDPSNADMDHTAVERQILEHFDDRTLLQVHQVFPVLREFQEWKLRPPSYMGSAERSLRGYFSDPPPEDIQIAMLYLGGLGELLAVARVSSYEALRAAVDEWYRGTTQTSIPTSAISQLRRAFLKPPRTTASRRQGGKVPVGGGSSIVGVLVPPTSLEAGPPMRPLTPTEAARLIPRLPIAKAHIWDATAEFVLMTRGVIATPQDIKRKAAVWEELVIPGISWLDILFFERGMEGRF